MGFYRLAKSSNIDRGYHLDRSADRILCRQIPYDRPFTLQPELYGLVTEAQLVIEHEPVFTANDLD